MSGKRCYKSYLSAAFSPLQILFKGGAPDSSSSSCWMTRHIRYVRFLNFKNDRTITRHEMEVVPRLSLR